MSKKPELIALAYAVIVFTSLFVHVPISVKINALDNAAKQINSNIIFETSSINEVLLIKLGMTYLLFTKTDITCQEFTTYALTVEALLLLVVRKASFVLHTSSSILFFHMLRKFVPEQRNSAVIV